MTGNIEARVLGQLLLMQSILTNLPDKKSIIAFVCQGLHDIPGVNKVCAHDHMDNPTPKNTLNFPIAISNTSFGYIEFHINDLNAFTPYNEYLKNFMFTIAVILEERRLRKKDIENKTLLEKKVAERTDQLTREMQERLTAQESLKISEYKFRLLAENSLDLISQLSPDGIMHYISPSSLQLLGFAPDELTGKSIFNQVHKEDKLRLEGEFRASLAQKSNLTISYKAIKKDGSYIWLESICKLIFNDKTGELTEIHVNSRDISERKYAEEKLQGIQKRLKIQNEDYLAMNEELTEINERMLRINQELLIAKEKAEESDRLKSAFLANMSHEVRTPMNAIVGFADLITDPGITEQKRLKCTHIIKSRTYDLLRIVEDILDISKIEVGQLKIFEREFDISNMLTELLVYYKYKISEKNPRSTVHIKLSIDSELKNIKIKTDQQRLKQVLTNLIDNAVKFTQNGLIEFGGNISGKNEFTFFVEDTGIGIPADKKEIVFDRFRTAEETISTRQFGGTGLGLSIVKGILNLMRGSIWLESVVGKGSTFYFSIPVQILQNHGENKARKPVRITDRLKAKTVLVVEDDKANLEYLKELLKETGAKLLLATNGSDTLELIKKNHNINIVLLDIRLPDVHGLSLVKPIKENNNKTIIIAQTAYASSSDKSMCINAGCDGFITKPIDKGKLYSTIIDAMP